MNRPWLFWGITGCSVVAILFLPIYMVFSVYPSLSETIIFEKEVDAQQLARNFGRRLAIESKTIGLQKEIISESFENMVKASLKDFDLVKIKVFSPNGETIYSTDKDDIGKINENSYFKNVVAKGKSYTKVVQKDERTLEGQILKHDVVETYAPLLRDNDFIGAFELYYDITYSKNRIKNLLTTAKFVLFIVAGFLLIIVIFSSIEANRFLQRKLDTEVKLKAINAELSVLFELSSSINTTVSVVELLPAIMDTIIRFNLVRVETRGGIFLVEGKNMELVYSLDDDPDFLQLHEKMVVGDCLCGLAAETGELLISDSCVHDERRTFMCNHHAVPEQDHGHVIIPLKNGTEVVGVLFLYTAKDVTIPKRKRQLLEIIGSQIGLIISNSRLYEKASSLSLSDPITGLSNRRQLEITLDRHVSLFNRYKNSFSVLMISIDSIEIDSDIAGSDAANDILKKIAEIIVSVVRESDLATRYSHEEFVIILAEVDNKRAALIAERLCRQVETETEVTISIGIASSYDDVVSEKILKKAAMALYQAKEEGKNRVIVYSV